MLSLAVLPLAAAAIQNFGIKNDGTLRAGGTYKDGVVYRLSCGTFNHACANLQFISIESPYGVHVANTSDTPADSTGQEHLCLNFLT